MQKIPAGLIALMAIAILALSYALRPELPTAMPSDDTPFRYTFNSDGALEEAGETNESTSAFWWLNSGGRMIIRDLRGETMQGNASPPDPWRIRYALDNPGDTDGGTHPQNIFRLVTRARWGDARIRALFFVVRDNFSASSHRNSSNGLLLMSRYTDAGQTLYYTGVRVDGTAIIKKKYKGTYYTLAQKKIFPGTYAGDRADTDLIPHGTWLSLQSESTTLADHSVRISLSMREIGAAEWTTLLSATDSGQYGGTPPLGPGYAGIRTDFMDMRFDSFRVEPH